MPQDLRYQRRILDAGDDPECAATFRTGLDVDGEVAFEPLHPAHGGRTSKAVRFVSMCTILTE